MESTPLLASSVEHIIAADALPGASVLSCFINLVKAVVGTGLLSLPHTFKRTGIGLGSALIVTGSVIIYYSLWLLGKCSHSTEIHTYTGLARKAGGVRFGNAVVFSQLGFAFGSCVAYMIIIPSSLAAVLDAWLDEGWFKSAILYHDHILLSVICAIVLVLPLCLSPSLDALRFSSTFGLLCDVYLVLLMVYLYWFRAPSSNSPLPSAPMFQLNFDSIVVLPVIFFAYNAHIQFLPIVSELSDSRWRNIHFLAFICPASCCVLYLVFAHLGYALYGDNVSDNVLLNFPKDSYLSDLALVAIAIDIIATYPLYAQPVVMSIHVLLFSKRPGDPVVQKRLLTVAYVLLSLVAARISRSLEMVLSLTGGIFATLLIFVFPGLIAMMFSYKPWMPGGLAALGIIIACCCAVVTFRI